MTDHPARDKGLNFLEINCAKHPNKPALIAPARNLSYGQLRDRARTLAQALYGLGVRPGDQVAIMSYNLPEVLEIRNALTYLEVGPVLVGYALQAPEIEYIVENSDSKILIFWHEFGDRILPNRDNYKKTLPQGLISFGGPPLEGALDYEGLFPAPAPLDLDNLPPAEKAGNSMIYTSGTTGRPKGAGRSTDFTSKPGVMEYVMASIKFFGYHEDEIHLVCCPLYHSAPSYFSNISFMLGGTLLYQPRFYPEQFLELVAKHKVTSAFLVPTMVSRLLKVPKEFTDKLDLSSLRAVIVGGAPLFPEHKLAFLERFGPCLFEFYGATETGINTSITPQEIKERPTSVGKAFANNELVIYDDDWNEVADGERGTLYMYNPLVMDGYYKNEKATKDSHRDKYITAGDVAIRDSEGFYYIVDRIKDMIIRGGVNIYPAEIEAVLIKISEIEDVAVVGRTDSELGETVAAFVVLNSEALISEDEIREFCAGELANYKIPKTIVFIQELPRNPTGKIVKRELREQLDS